MVKNLLFFLFLASSLMGGLPTKVVICGVGKNVAPFLPMMRTNIENIGKLFDDYRVIVYENDSSDETPAFFANWSRENGKVVALSEKVSDVEFAKSCLNREIHGWFYRPERIARARNIVLDLAMSSPYDEFPFILWVDLDFDTPFSLKGIKEVFESKQEWDAVFANGLDSKNDYFDWYAFRDERYPIGAELLGNSWWHLKKKLCLRPGDAWYPVYSAFGGLGIYKKSSIQGCHYAAIVTPDMESVYQKILSDGAKKQNPSVLKYTEENRHLTHIKRIVKAEGNLPKTENLEVGILLSEEAISLIWKMNSGVCQYPSTCEHVAFHASMIHRGHAKLFINPNLIMRYAR